MLQVSQIAGRLKSTLREYLEATYHIWDESLIQKRRALLEQRGAIASDLYLEGNPSYQSGRHIGELNIPSLAATLFSDLSRVIGSGVWPNPRSHQCEAIEEFLGFGNDIIVASGTGSGKTESFLYPMLGSLAMEASRPLSNVMQHGVRFLLLYPMNALVNDQLTRLRAMYGHEEVAQRLEQVRHRRVTFGVYTSRTPYPGVRTAEKDERHAESFRKNFPLDPEKERKLREQTMWPSKADMNWFLESGLQTSDGDSELLTRHEMQTQAPDLMVTNYSMLEYMLARPIEQPIFDQTARWLSMHDENCLTIVLDEAHVYRGVGGTEVAYLIRRLASRLGLRSGSPKLRFIVTTASLGSEDNAVQAKQFVSDLTGASPNRFTLITSKKLVYASAERATDREIHALAEMDFSCIQDINNPQELFSTLSEPVSALLGRAMDSRARESADILRSEVYALLEKLAPAKLLANILTNGAKLRTQLIEDVFGRQDQQATQAFDSLLFLMVFGERRDVADGKKTIFQPVRVHALFRGMAGLYACLNPGCGVGPQTGDTPNPLGVGRVFLNPQIACSCGSKVYEIFTHRRCGAAFIRAYYNQSDKTFLLGSAARYFSDSSLRECHLSLEPAERINVKNREFVYLDWRTGQLSQKLPQGDAQGHSIRRLYKSSAEDVDIGGRSVWTFKSCPVCRSRCVKDGVTKIQDLSTKGEEPLAHLIREQIACQIPTKPQTRKYPLSGKKSLVFSDGRQKAARLARDMPETIARQAFRACLIEALMLLQDRANASDRYKRTGPLVSEIYGAFVVITFVKNGALFNSDPDSERRLEDDWRSFEEFLDDECNGDIEAFRASDQPKDFVENFNLFCSRLVDGTRPLMFDKLLLENFCHEYYSLPSLFLIVFGPSELCLRRIRSRLDDAHVSISDEQLISLLHNWIHAVIQRDWAYSSGFSRGVRADARGSFGGGIAGYVPPKKLGQRGVYCLLFDLNDQQKAKVEEIVLAEMCETSANEGGAFFLKPIAVSIELNPESIWYQCNECTKIFYKPLSGCCPHGSCGSRDHRTLDVNDSAYLRARKGFYRDPLVTKEERDRLLPISVEEHTAQLSHRDDSENTSTSERHERLFKDILLDDKDRPIDVLSCTTTMEVGVDIGSLVAVAMRNVPPARQNYQQRAGRAGRRGASISTVLTYAQTGSHDSYYFENPEPLISGPPVLPRIDVVNEKIVTRHVHAGLIQSFFHRHALPEVGQADLMRVLGKTSTFYEGDNDFSLEKFENYVEDQIRSGQIADLLSWIPDTTFVDQAATARSLVESLREKKPEDLTKVDNYEEDFLNFLFYEDLLPTYAFPRNIVELRIEKEERKGQGRQAVTIEQPQQSLATALTEYAPRRATVVNKKTYIIGTVASRTGSGERDRAKRLFDKKKRYFQCSVCAYTEELSQDDLDTDFSHCKHCGSADKSVLTVIQPEVVYPSLREARSSDDDIEDTYTRATSAQLPFVQAQDRALEDRFSATTTVLTQADQRLVMLNKGEQIDRGYSGFFVCRACGKADLELPNSSGQHERDYIISGFGASSNKCSESFENVSLGYSFNSDVFLLRIDLGDGLVVGNNRLDLHALICAGRSLAEAIMRSATVYFDCENGELDCGVRRLVLDSTTLLDIFIYDTTAGGAGYSRRIGSHQRTIFSNAKKFLDKNCCDDSCYQCLRDFRNRFSHDLLHKDLGLSLWQYVNAGKTPAHYDFEKQVELGAPLTRLMELLGYAVTRSPRGQLLYTLGDETKEVLIYPVLADLSKAAPNVANRTLMISDFEIRHSLSGVFEKVKTF